MKKRDEVLVRSTGEILEIYSTSIQRALDKVLNDHFSQETVTIRSLKAVISQRMSKAILNAGILGFVMPSVEFVIEEDLAMLGKFNIEINYPGAFFASEMPDFVRPNLQ
jgi:hypothetical protein